MKRLLASALIVLVGTGLVIPSAHAARRLTVHQVCASYLPDYKPFAVPGGVRCAANPAQLFWGGSRGLEIGLIDVLAPGSHRVDPRNPWSDWIVTG